MRVQDKSTTKLSSTSVNPAKNGYTEIAHASRVMNTPTYDKMYMNSMGHMGPPPPPQGAMLYPTPAQDETSRWNYVPIYYYYNDKAMMYPPISTQPSYVPRPNAYASPMMPSAYYSASSAYTTAGAVYKPAPMVPTPTGSTGPPTGYPTPNPTPTPTPTATPTPSLNPAPAPSPYASPGNAMTGFAPTHQPSYQHMQPTMHSYPSAHLYGQQVVHNTTVVQQPQRTVYVVPSQKSGTQTWGGGPAYRSSYKPPAPNADFGTGMIAGAAAGVMAGALLGATSRPPRHPGYHGYRSHPPGPHW
ncbi:uncharacterized protein LOC144922948 isoform X2 [Branchiostoma floridae x Branchiostoma belcheri]